MTGSTTIDVINRALVGYGVEPVTDLADGSAAADVMANAYDGVVRHELALYPWRFASRFQHLTPLAADPLPGFHQVLQEPAEALRLIGVYSGAAGWPVPFDRVGRQIHTGGHGSGPGGLFVRYVIRPAEADWPDYFESLIVAALAPLVARGIKEQTGEADAAEVKLRDDARPRAHNADAQQHTTRRMPVGRLVAARSIGHARQNQIG